eukprot:6179843-Pleurochrysis_carterae.AAC.4
MLDWTGWMLLAPVHSSTIQHKLTAPLASPHSRPDRRSYAFVYNAEPQNAACQHHLQSVARRLGKAQVHMLLTLHYHFYSTLTHQYHKHCSPSCKSLA